MSSFTGRLIAVLTTFVALMFTRGVCPAENAAPLSAGELASRLGALQQDGPSYVRLRMEISGSTKTTFQIQIKQRRTKSASEVLYQVLWPKEHKGDAVLLRQIGNHLPTGTAFTPPNTVRSIDDLKGSLLGGDLSYQDAIENFFLWSQQVILGAEDVGGVKCQILESKPGNGEHSIYGSVRAWIDSRRMVPLRIEKYSASGQLLRRIDITQVVLDGANHIPADFVVHGPRAETSTILDGSRIRHDVNYTDANFTPNGLGDLSAPRTTAN